VYTRSHQVGKWLGPTRRGAQADKLRTLKGCEFLCLVAGPHRLTVDYESRVNLAEVCHIQRHVAEKPICDSLGALLRVLCQGSTLTILMTLASASRAHDEKPADSMNRVSHALVITKPRAQLQNCRSAADLAVAADVKRGLSGNVSEIGLWVRWP
jgi:hypothetical protein